MNRRRTILTLCLAMLATAAGWCQDVNEYYQQNPTQDYGHQQRSTGTVAQPEGFDPNLWVFLCFGQSNMEGNAQAEDVDMMPMDPRFLMLSAVDMPSRGRQRGQWYVAYPPLHHPWMQHS